MPAAFIDFDRPCRTPPGKEAGWGSLWSYRSAVYFSGVLVLLAGFVVVSLGVWITVISYSPVPYSDQWSILQDLATGKDSPLPNWLWEQHNEHRIPLARLSLIADLHLFGGHSLFLFFLTFFVLTAHWVLWISFIKSTLAPPLLLWMPIAGFFGFCIFCPSQYENLSWSFQWNFLATFTFASASFISLTWFSLAKQPWKAVIISSAAALCCESCLANGMLTWPLLWIGAMRLPLKAAPRLTLGYIGGASIALYLRTYQTPSYHSNPSDTIRQPGKVALYLLTYFGHCLSNFVVYPELVTVGLTFLAAVALWVLFRRQHTKFLALTLALTMCFVLSTGYLTALGRLKFGLTQAMASRYQTPVMLYWACVFTVLILAAWELSSWRDVVTLNLLGLCVIILPFQNLLPLVNQLRSRANVLNSFGESLDQGVLDPIAQNAFALGGQPLATIELATAYLHHLQTTVGPRPIKLQKTLVAQSTLDSKACEGAFDTVSPLPRFDAGPREIRADGWTIDLYTHKPAKLVAIADQTGSILAVSAVHAARPDVLLAVHGATGDPGWHVYVPVTAETKTLRAFAFGEPHACLVGAHQLPN